MKRHILFTVLLFAVYLPISYAYGDYHWQRFTSNNDVRAMVWDRINSDNLWIGTNGGLLRYNVVSGGTLLYNMINSDLPSDIITTLAIASNNDLWIGTASQGLAKYDGSNFTVYNTDNSALLNNYIRRIDFDETGALWVGFRSGTIASYDVTDMTLLMSNEGDRYPWIRLYDMHVQASDDIWACGMGYMASYIKHFDGESWTEYGHWGGSINKAPDGNVWVTQNTRALSFQDINSDWIIYDDLPVPSIGIVYIDESNVKWFGGQYGLVRFDDEEWEVFETGSYALPSDAVRFLLEDRYNEGMWIGTNRGLTFFDGNDFFCHDINVSGLLSNAIYDGAVDQSGNIWFATDRGLCRYDGYAFTSFTTLNSPLISDRINALAVDASGRLWVGTGDGLYCYENGTWHEPYYAGNHIRLLTLDLNDNLYVKISNSTYYDSLVDPYREESETERICSLFLINLENMEVITYLSQPWGPTTVLGVDNNNHLWFNSRDCIVLLPWDPSMYPSDYYFDYVYRYDGTTVHYSPVFENILHDDDDGILLNQITAENEGIWLATSRRYYNGVGDLDHSLFFFENNQITNYYNILNSPLPHYNVLSLLIEDDIFWIGTEAGLGKLTGDEWEIFTVDNSLLPADRITQIFSENSVRTWFITGNGVAVYGEPLSVEKDTGELIPALSAHPPYPNPFNSIGSNRKTDGVTIRYVVPEDSIVRINVYNVLGQHIKKLKDEFVRKGEYHVSWKTDDQKGRNVPSGVYFYKIETEREAVTRKVLILR